MERKMENEIWFREYCVSGLVLFRLTVTASRGDVPETVMTQCGPFLRNLLG